MDNLVTILVLGAFALLLYGWLRKRSQLRFIEHYRFEPSLAEKLLARYPHLSTDQIALVQEGLRDYFYICSKAGRRLVSMPSQAVDVAWHEFILHTRAYQAFCKQGFGRFLHHTPSEAMRTPTSAQDGIKRAWRLACSKARINPESPEKLPLLFAIDADFEIPDGFRYSLNCQDPNSPLYGSGYCAGHIGCGGGCGGDSGCGGGCGGD